MANDVDEFTIKYKVETGDASKKLEEFNRKLKQTKKNGGGAKAYVGEMGKELTSMATKAVRAGAVVALAFTAIAKAISSTVEAMKDYNEQALLAAKIGIGSIGQESISMNLARASGGRLGRMDSRAAMKSVGETLMGAYTDPTGSNSQNIRLRMLGISPVGKGGNIANTGDTMDQLGERWKKMTKEMAQAEGELIGLTPQATAAIRELGGAVTDNSNLTLESAKRQRDAAEAAGKLNDALSGMDTDLSTIAKTMIDEAMPAMAEFFGMLHEGTSNVANTFSKHGVWGGTKELLKAAGEDLVDRLTGKPIKSLKERLEANDPKDSPEEHQQALDIAKTNKDAAVAQTQASAKMQLTVAQFSAAVSAMPGALSEAEAIAAWVGEVAKGMTTGGAGGMGKIPNGSGGSGRGGGSGGFIDSVAEIESNNRNIPQEVVDINTKKGTPAGGYFQIIDPTWKRYAQVAGVDTGKYPNAMSAPRAVQAQVAARIPANQFGPRTQRMLKEKFGGFNKNLTLGELDSQFSGSGVVPGMGISEGAMLSGASAIAQLTGVDRRQLMAGTLSRGDVKYNVDKQRFALTKQILELKAQIASANQVGRPQLRAEAEGKLYRAQNDLNALDRYGQSFIDHQKGGDEQVRTKGMMPIPPITININSNQDPAEMAKQMGLEMQRAMQDFQSKYVS